MAGTEVGVSEPENQYFLVSATKIVRSCIYWGEPGRKDIRGVSVSLPHSYSEDIVPWSPLNILVRVQSWKEQDRVSAPPCCVCVLESLYCPTVVQCC